MDEQVTAPEEAPSSRRRHRLAIALVAGSLALAVAAVAGYAWWLTERDTPQAALTDLASAAVSGDATAVAESIDTTSLVDSAVDDVFSESDERRALIAEYLAKHPDATQDSVKRKARALLNEELREHVESGTLPKRIPVGNETLKELAAKAFARGTVRSVKVNGNTARVLVVGKYRGKTIRAWVLMKRVNGKWKVVGVDNPSDVLRQAGY